ncbi:defensin-like [Drosophila kikkawai]|uniref:Defensin-like n=1 Tax=Drosophila kikkawai TaxID=30033 RepID=A0A6P4I869_DROKI|nr:defensin-like [Drosophila kikkawai]
MKIILFLALAFAFVACLVQAQPVKEEALPEHLLAEAVEQPDQATEEQADQGVAEHSRQKRATCDLLSKWNWNHTACAAHCLARGNKGGYCNDKAVCVCRR